MCYLIAYTEQPHRNKNAIPFFKVRVSSFGTREDPKWYPELSSSIPLGYSPGSVLSSIELTPSKDDIHAVTVSWQGHLGHDEFSDAFYGILKWTLGCTEHVDRNSASTEPFMSLSGLFDQIQNHLENGKTQQCIVQAHSFEDYSLEIEQAVSGQDDLQSPPYSLQVPEWFSARIRANQEQSTTEIKPWGFFGKAKMQPLLAAEYSVHEQVHDRLIRQ